MLDEDLLKIKKRDGFRGERMIVLPTESFQDYVTHPIVSRLYITDIGYFPTARHHDRERPEGVDQYIFFYCLKGSGTIMLGEEKYELSANQAFTIPIGAPHHYYASEEDPWSILWVHFKGTDAQLYPIEEKHVISFDSGEAAGRMFGIFDILLRVLDGDYTLGNFIYLTQLLSLALTDVYYRSAPEDSSMQSHNVTRVIRYMTERITEPLSTQDILDEFGWSKSYLNIIFQKYTQSAPMVFFTQMKMRRACEELRSTDKRVIDVALSLGYGDPYYFSRLFKKYTGVSPQKYRENPYYAESFIKTTAPKERK